MLRQSEQNDLVRNWNEEKRVQCQPKWGRSPKLCVQQQQHQQRCDIFRNETPNTQPFTRNKSFSIRRGCRLRLRRCRHLYRTVCARFFRWEHQFNGHLNAANIVLAFVSASSSLFFSCSFIFLSTHTKINIFGLNARYFEFFTQSVCECVFGSPLNPSFEHWILLIYMIDPLHKWFSFLDDTKNRNV